MTRVRLRAPARLVALGLAVLVAATSLPATAHRRPQVPATPQVVDQVDGVNGDDACGLLSDEEILKASGAKSVISKTPGSQVFLSAGCYWQLESTSDLYGPWELWLGIETTGGRQRFEQENELFGNPHIGGLGDDATVMFGSTYSAVKGDAYVSLQYLAFGGDSPRPSGLVARALTWLIMKRLTPATTTGPTPTPGPTGAPVTAARALVERIRAEPFGDDNVRATIELLARSGIGTYDTPTATDPIVAVDGVASPLTLLRDQVRAMALEAWAGGGILGAELDPLVPAEPELGAASWIVASYVAAVETEGAEVSRALMGEQDWAQAPSLVFPQLVLTLFASDIARDRMAEPGTANAPIVRAGALAMVDGARTAQGGFCSDAQAFLDGAISRLFEALRFGNGGGGNVLKQIWNFFVSIAELAFRALVQEFTQPVLDMIGRVAAMAGMVSSVVSALRPWAVTVTGVPPVTAKGVGGSGGQPGQLVVRVDLGGLDKWPPYVEDCAQLARVPLPNLKPEGAPVTWQPVVQIPDGLVSEGARQTRLDADGVARLDYMTLVDELPAPWQDQTGHLLSVITVERPQLEQLRNVAFDALFAQLGRARGLIEPYLRPTLEQLTQRIERLISTNASGPATVIYHVPAATPPPDATPQPTAAPREVWVELERPASGDLIKAARVIELVSCSGPYGPWSGVLRLGGIGPVPVSELPVGFTFRGASGVQRTTTSTSGRVPWVVPEVAYQADLNLDLTVDGTTMTVAINGRIGEEVAGSELLAVSGSGAPARALPIKPAPAGRCP